MVSVFQEETRPDKTPAQINQPLLVHGIYIIGTSLYPTIIHVGDDHDVDRTRAKTVPRRRSIIHGARLATVPLVVSLKLVTPASKAASAWQIHLNSEGYLLYTTTSLLL